MHRRSNSNQGFIVLVSSFVFLIVSLFVLSYLKILHDRFEANQLKKAHLQAYWAARSGIDDALYELKQGTSWPSGVTQSQWQTVNATTLQKSTLFSTPLTHFDYPATYSVSVAFESGTSGTINMTSNATVSSVYQSQIVAKAVRTDAGKLYILEMKEQ